MAKRKYNLVDPFMRTPEMVTEDGKLIENGDIIKIKGQWGTKFIFQALVFNPANSRSWVDCIEMEKGHGSRFRSFYVEDVRYVPKPRPKRVRLKK
jgi:hypothetical protein